MNDNATQPTGAMIARCEQDVGLLGVSRLERIQLQLPVTEKELAPPNTVWLLMWSGQWRMWASPREEKICGPLAVVKDRLNR
jgi:hypothetical protein